MAVTAFVIEIAERLVALSDASETSHGVEFHSKRGVDLARHIPVAETPFVEELLPKLLSRLVESWPLKRHLTVNKVMRYVEQQLDRDTLA